MARQRTQSAYGGKLVDTWFYEYEGIEDSDTQVEVDEESGESRPKPVVAPIKVKVELRIHKKYAESLAPPLATKEVWFSVECPERKIKFEGTDIEAMRAAMWGELVKAYAVKWERYLLVEVSRHGPYRGSGTGIEFSYNDVEKGTAFDGTLLLRKWEMRDWKVEPWPGEFRNKNGRVIACIPATEFNETALKEFCDKIDDMRKQMAKFFEPERIMATLANLNGMALLSGPADADD